MSFTRLFEGLEEHAFDYDKYLDHLMWINDEGDRMINEQKEKEDK